jgi:hypothetical protein
MTFQLGETVQDRITGFTGTITGHVRYITGCNQVLLVPRVDKDGKTVPGEWFDEQRVERVDGTPRIVLNNGTTPGSDIAPPRRL